MKKGEVTIMVLADFSKAFDMGCFKTTIAKFYKMGFSKLFLKSLLDYMSNRSQFVWIDDEVLSLANTQFGIPQGSILGPMIFNFCITDLHKIVPPSTNFSPYADDTSLYSSCSVADLTIQEKEINDTLDDLNSWSHCSNLALNPSKTKSMLFSTSQSSEYHLLGSRQTHLSVGGMPIVREKSAKLLGVQLNERLKWDHIKHLATSCYGAINIS